MFEVTWSDPNTETVGERKSRKKDEGSEKGKAEDHRSRYTPSVRSSFSTDRKFSFFGSRRKKSAATLASSSRPVSAATEEQDADGRSRRTSTYSSASFSASTDNREGSNRDSTLSYPPEQSGNSSENSLTRSSKESAFSKWADNPLTTPASLPESSLGEPTKPHQAQVVQSLGPSSYITKSTEVTIAPRHQQPELVDKMSETVISADLPRLDQPVTPVLPTDKLVNQDTIEWLSSLHATPTCSAPLVPNGANTTNIQSPLPPRNPRGHLTHPPPSWPARFRSNHTDSWKPPDTWDCGSPNGYSQVTQATTPATTNESRSSMSLDLAGIQREVKRMAAASDYVVLMRLKEKWGTSTNAEIYKELEMERKRWMLSALSRVELPREDEVKPLPRTQKILALYETQATASYLAALQHYVPVYHLSPKPLSPHLFPNIHPLTSPALSPTSIPVAPKLFTSVYSLSLPSLLAAQDIPHMLRNINRCLAVRGTLHLTLIDPAPCTHCMGPLMRAWLEENLLLNLERRFRCTNPRKLFPNWLADASLRGDGSTITSVKFLAIYPSKAPSEDSGEDPEGTKVELNCVLGRLLWQEVWGTFVTAKDWWWEQPSIVDECIRMGTYWEYCRIETVKSADLPKRN